MKHKEARNEYKPTTHQLLFSLREGEKELLKITEYMSRKSFESLLFCCQQGIALQGHQEVIDNNDKEDTSINYGNFRSLMLLQAKNDEIENDDWSEKCNLAKY